jgi:hypothetical protein
MSAAQRTRSQAAAEAAETVTMTKGELLSLMLQSIDAALNIAEMYDTSDDRVQDRIIAETVRRIREAVSS